MSAAFRRVLLKGSFAFVVLLASCGCASASATATAEPPESGTQPSRTPDEPADGLSAVKQAAPGSVGDRGPTPTPASLDEEAQLQIIRTLGREAEDRLLRQLRRVGSLPRTYESEDSPLQVGRRTAADFQRCRWEIADQLAAYRLILADLNDAPGRLRRELEVRGVSRGRAAGASIGLHRALKVREITRAYSLQIEMLEAYQRALDAIEEMGEGWQSTPDRVIIDPSTPEEVVARYDAAMDDVVRLVEVMQSSPAITD